MKKISLVLCMCAMLIFTMVSAVQALTIALTNDRSSGGLGGSPGTVYATVDLVQNGTEVDFTVHVNSPYVWAVTGAADFTYFKFNATNVALADIVVDNPPANPTPPLYVKPYPLAAENGILNGDGTGLFSFGIYSASAGGGLSTFFNDDIKFHVLDSTIADFLILNNRGYIFVADLGNSWTGNTGPVTTSEPGTLLLLGTGLIGFVVVRRFWN